MNINQMFKSIVDLDEMAVVLCDINHTIVYMNYADVRKYEKRGGKALIGKNLLDCHNQDSRDKIIKILKWFSESKENNKFYTYHNERNGVNQDVFMVAVRDENDNVIGYYEKFEDRNLFSAD
ncbi:MAG: fatty acid/phospholipid synthesis protein PlsX [Oscillospiraceae bacterium]